MPHLSKAKVKLFAALQQKKFRQKHMLFLGEGKKLLQEALRSGIQPEAVVLAPGTVAPAQLSEDKLFHADSADFKRLSTQVHSEGIISVLPMPDLHAKPLPGPAFLLENLRDPGNLGTLIRTADWFGFPQLICSSGTVDAYNPKVVRAAMGSLFRVQVTYLNDFAEFVQEKASQVWVADMNGQNAFSTPLQSRPYILLGNEANGVSDSIRQQKDIAPITIPRIGEAESLNVGIAAGVLAAAWQNSN